MVEYKNQNWVKNGKIWVNVRMKIRLHFGFFMVEKSGET